MDSPIARPVGFRPSEISALLNEEVVHQHWDDAAFVWSSRDRAVRAPQYRLKDLLRLDARVRANLEGLRVAGEYGQDLTAKRADPKVAGSIFVATVVAVEARSDQRIRSAMRLCLNKPELVPQVLSGLGWTSFLNAKFCLDELLEMESPFLRSLAMRGYAVHRQDPGDILKHALLDPDPILRNAAIRSAGELGRSDLAHFIARNLSMEEPGRYFAAWSCARLGVRHRDVIDVLLQTAESESPYAEDALRMALRAMKRQDATVWLRSLLEDPRLLRRGLIGIGAFGDPAFMPSLMEYLAVDNLARVAGESFSMLTGIDLKYFDLDRDRPEDFEAGPTDDPAAPVVEMDADEELPWPSPERVKDWWHRHRLQFSNGEGYLRGQLLTDAALLDALQNGFQRQRAAAALALAVLHPSDPLFNVADPSGRQLTKLNQWTQG